jgi:hypothetical protein
MSTSQADIIVNDSKHALDALLRRTDKVPDLELGEAYHGRNVSDMIAHLHAWHLLLSSWLEQEQAGDTPELPAPGYTWDQLADLNRAIYEEHRGRSYEDNRALLIASHRELVDVLTLLTDEELTAPDAFVWLGGDPLGPVAEECLTLHYGWAEGVLTAANVPA